MQKIDFLGRKLTVHEGENNKLASGINRPQKYFHVEKRKIFFSLRKTENDSKGKNRNNEHSHDSSHEHNKDRDQDKNALKTLETGENEQESSESQENQED